jgi:hypothetical protein
MSSTPKIAVITAASIGMVLTQSSSLLAENQDRSEVIKIAAPIDLDEEVLYSALPDEALERAAGFVGACATAAQMSCGVAHCLGGQQTSTSNCGTGIADKANKKVPPLSKSRTAK